MRAAGRDLVLGIEGAGGGSVTLSREQWCSDRWAHAVPGPPAGGLVLLRGTECQREALSPSALSRLKEAKLSADSTGKICADPHP